LLCPIAGRLSDRFGRRRTILLGRLGHVVLAASTRLTSGSLGFQPRRRATFRVRPLIAAALVASTGLTSSPAFLLAGVALFSLVVLFLLASTLIDDLQDKAGLGGR
jgi:MHS family proline/betaine transporter-like MFS transporter